VYALTKLLSDLKSVFQGVGPALSYLNEEPLRAELFSSDQMERFGKALAGIHKLTVKSGQDHLLRRLSENRVTLNEVRKLLTDSIKKKYQISPAGEWLMDNFYLIEEHIRNAKKHFPRDYSENLPQLLDGTSPGQTRVYDIVLQIISHSDGRIDLESLSGFVKSYQTITHLQLGELWAIPIMLRLGLIENLRRVSARIAIDRLDRNLADYWAGQMIEIAENNPKNLILVIADMARSNPPIVSSFVSELTRQLRGKGSDLALSLNWIEQQLSESGLTSTELVNAEVQKQAADQASMSNSIGSLRLLGAMDWRDFVETHSIVEQTLRDDKDGTYGLMDFATRDRYRHVVEHISKESQLTEQQVAQLAIQLARDKCHVGYFLIGQGINETRKQAKMHISAAQGFRFLMKKQALQVYLASVFLITVVISAGILIRAGSDTKIRGCLILLACLSLLCSSQLAISVVNFFSTLLVKPELLPRMDFSLKIPPDCRTIVVVPVMLTHADEIEHLAEALEVRFLANRNDNLHFGLLTDFKDAPQESTPEDQVLIDLAKHKIEDLNKKYQRKKCDLFFLFHRPRKWNPDENAWMGYERKRGKLADLNSLLRGGAKECFSLIIGDQSVFPQIKYVITLDADTQLPLGTAWKLIGTIAHPLNRAWYDEKKKRVTKGYGILQPRVTVSLPDITGSLYARMHGNEPGIDPYTRASSDVYQDLFGEGSFIGKGIYDIDIFKKVLDGRFSENGILSHDLLEGCYVRSGLLSDVQLFEKYPTSYQADMKRHFRWIRGDWQIFAWFLPFVPGLGRHWYKNPISGLSRWKIFDNIRRSLVPVGLTVMVLMGWLILPSSLFWTLAVSGIIVIPIIITAVWDAIHKPKDVVLKHHIKNSVHSIVDIFKRTLFTLICLPNEAFSNLKAILRTVWRMLISRKKLLEWNPSVHVEIINPSDLRASYSSMWVEPFLTVVVFFWLAIYSPVKLIIAGPIVLLWMLAPLITWWRSQPLEKQTAELTDQQIIFLRKLARRTWSFFERFVGEGDNWLPPDNYQERPVVQLAHRTSPTNIGLSLLATLTALDFGFITTGQFIGRTTKTIDTLRKMERYNGHFYNWYDTETLNPLLPKYISTVDSGNLVAHLLILRQGLLALPHKKITDLRLFEGLRDTLHVLYDSLEVKNKEYLEQFRMDLDAACNTSILTFQEAEIHIGVLAKSIGSVPDSTTQDTEIERIWWKQMLDKQLIHVKDEIQRTLTRTKLQLEEQNLAIKTLAQQCNELADMEWGFLYDKQSNLFTIGYNVQEREKDASYYDLLASEARQCTFIGISQGKVPVDSWFSLGRLLTNVDGAPILLSWSGSMFEYLMPLLIMPTYENTLLDQTCKAAVEWQIKYGKQVGKPWGISESGYNMISANSNYQYRAFGAPGLGLKRGLEEDSVIAPYASALALMVAPEQACENLELLDENGFQGRHGFYEAIDYTPSRLERGQSCAVVYSFMAHHQGMSLLSLAYLLLDKPMQKLFESEPQFKAALLLLQERIPVATIFFAHTTDIADITYAAAGGAEARLIQTPDTVLPEVQLLSNGRYHVMVTNAGGGYSRWNDIAVTRWREDRTCDNWGTFCYIRDLKSGDYWSATHQPTLKKGDKYEVEFSQGRVDFSTRNSGIEAHTQIVVSPEDDIEMRRLQLTNRSEVRRTIEITGYTEVVIAPAASDVMQPAFSNLFVQTEIIPLQHAILCTRRPRSAEDQPPWMFHVMALNGKSPEEVSYETNRMEFIGRGNTVVNPQVMNYAGPLAGNQGSVLDPVTATRYKITLDPDETVTIDRIIGIAGSREVCQGLIDKYQDKHHKDRVFEMAWTHSQVVLRQINATEADAQLYGRLASSVLFTNAAFRADPSVLIKNQRGQSGLWGYSISGDLPIVLLKIEKQTNTLLAKQLIQAHAYWRLKGLAVDLVIWNEEHNGYRQVVQNEIQALIPAEFTDRPGGIFVRASDQLSNEDRILFQTVARVIISDTGGTLAEHIAIKKLAKAVIPYIIPAQSHEPVQKPLTAPADLVFFNELGGFSADGKEYVITIEDKIKTPAPWVNVIANPNFGTVISESGSAYTWMENAHELRLSPWSNDPVSDLSGEAYYLRDEESGNFWSTSLLPAGGQSPYITRHGFGYSVFEHTEDGIYSKMLVYVDCVASVKFTVLKIRNRSGRTRKLSATGYTEWVLGTDRTKTAMHIHTEMDPESGALFAKNQYDVEFYNRVAFFDVDGVKKSFTGDRTEFIGRNGTLKNPDAMSRIKLSGRVGLALDPCAALQVPFDLEEDAEFELVFRLGAGKDSNAATELARQFRGLVVAHDSFERVKKYWQHTIGALQVETPDAALNILTNGWLTYQTLSSRLWGRSGFYQSGGAYGFRDQLQDGVALLYTLPELAREQILLSASRQFMEGDVQHWWHPPGGRGVRTRCSDDFLWLPYVTSLYIIRTGDYGILKEPVQFLEGRLLNKGEESYFDQPITSAASSILYLHCVRAIKHGLSYGEHGLPLIETGDWNDGYDKVGKEGKGESVWLAFFLYKILLQFEEIARSQKDSEFADQCKKEAYQLKENIGKHAWDGEWYKRAWFDDGTPLGAAGNEECKIDSIAQSWAVLSGAGDPILAKTAMESAYKILVQKEPGIIQLLNPPFDKSTLNPGYIKGYVPGVRENGGQYTHAAIWMILAFAGLGDKDRVWELMNMINPINHGKTAGEIAVYKVEPYVLAADVYAHAPHAGRGGWTWYTGSAGWMYRLIIESFLGLQQKADTLIVVPCIPKDWDSFKVHYRYKSTTYHISVRQQNKAEGMLFSSEEMIVSLDGINQENKTVMLMDDKMDHAVQVLLIIN